MTEKALVVDDETIILDLLENVLERQGYTITRASSGEEAVEALKTEAFDLVITDLQMGDTSGLEVVRTAKSLDKQTIVIMITGCYEARYAVDAFYHGADEYLLKPLSLHELLDRIQLQALKRHYSSASTLRQGLRAECVSG